MNAGFTKLFSSIVTSTIWQEDDKTRIVWITMLALADAQGQVEGSVPGLAHIAHVGLPECEHALERLSSPDPYSRTQDFEGRRIEAIDGGWRILNYTKYRERRDPDKRREQNRDAKRRQRDRECQPDVSQSQPKSAQAESESEADAEAERNPKSSSNPKSLGLGSSAKGSDFDPKTFSSLTESLTKILQPKNQSHRTGIQARLQWAMARGDDMVGQAIRKAGLAREQAQPGKVINYWYKSMQELGYTSSPLRATFAQILGEIRVTEDSRGEG